MGTLVKVADDWDALTDSEKAALFESHGLTGPIPGSDVSPLGIVKVARFDPIPPLTAECQISAIPYPQVVLPKGLIPLGGKTLTKAEIDHSTAGTGSVKMAVTTDLSAYKVFKSGAWIDVDVSTYDKFAANGMPASDINSLTSANWALLGASNIGFAYLPAMMSTSDTAETDELRLTLQISGSLKQVALGTYYDVSDLGDSLTVSLYKDGDFVIAYPE